MSTVNSNSAASSRTSSPRSVCSANFDRFERRFELDNLLKEANLDRKALLEILRENPVSMDDLDESKIQSIVQQASTSVLPAPFDFEGECSSGLADRVFAESETAMLGELEGAMSWSCCMMSQAVLSGSFES